MGLVLAKNLHLKNFCICSEKLLHSDFGGGTFSLGSGTWESTLLLFEQRTGLALDGRAVSFLFTDPGRIQASPVEWALRYVRTPP